MRSRPRWARSCRARWCVSTRFRWASTPRPPSSNDKKLLRGAPRQGECSLMALPVSESLRQVLVATLEKCRRDGVFEGDLPAIAIERPKKAEHGDFATTVALALAKRAKKNPREVAEMLRTQLVDPEGLVTSSDVAGPGFLNFRIADRVWRATLGEVLSRGAEYGRGQAPAGSPRILVEYVSANPTGPLHVGHGRCAAIGDGVARLITFAGYDVSREFYINDAGN